jgi:hypothetical protein
VHLSDGTLIEVQDPGNVIVGRSSVILPTRVGYDENGRRVAKDWRTIAQLHIVQFTDVEPARRNAKPADPTAAAQPVGTIG